MMPFSVETLVPSGPRNLGQSLPGWAAATAGKRIKQREAVSERMKGYSNQAPGRAQRALGVRVAYPQGSLRSPWGLQELLAILLRLDLRDLLDAAGVPA